ncbi:MAG: TlpA family protein disulfide reductase [Acidobacteriaceae bacterium]|nr:TlpA family protein disulfide reductase [Acidobacteriaceae bacterium]MBV9779187.1 TlpA family protein disulfide reductase [Acidobacteriaceae bacterium]
MTRRACLLSLAASPACLLAGTSTLIPLGEQAFHQMVARHRGKVLLVDFWATWCGGCREEMPKLVTLYSSERKNDFSFVTISCDEPEQAAAAISFLEKQSAPAPYYLKSAKNDDQFISAIDPKWSGALPALFLFDRTGQKVNSFIGETDIQQLKVSIDKLL